MTPKEKAKELVKKFEETTHPISRIMTDGKACALLCVEEQKALLRRIGTASAQYEYDELFKVQGELVKL